MELTKSLLVVTMRSVSKDDSIVVLVGLEMIFCILKLSKMVCSILPICCIARVIVVTIQVSQQKNVRRF